MEIGTELREARQRAGLSAEQVSERTKIRVEKIRALEQNAFEQLPAGIFLDGIVKAYAYEVGYDARAALRRLHGDDVANLEGWVSEADLPISAPKTAATPVVAPPSGAHVVKPTAAPVVKPAAPVVKPAEAQAAKPAVEQVVRPSATQVVKPPAAQVVRPSATHVVRPSGAHVVRPPAAPVVKPPVAPVLKPVAARAVTPEVARVIEPAAVPIQKPAAAPVMWSEAAGVVEPPATVEPGVASAAALDSARGRRSPLRTPAFALLGLFAATGWGLYLYSIMPTGFDHATRCRSPRGQCACGADRIGCRSALGRGSQHTPHLPAAAERAVFPRAANAASRPSPTAPNAPAAIATPAPATVQTTAPARAATQAATPPPSVTKAAAPAPAATTRPPASGLTASAPAATSAAAPTPAAPTAATASEAAAGTPAPPLRAAGGVSGAWDLTTQVLSTNNDNVKGLRLGYRVDLVQNGARVTGRGRRTTENGQAFSSDAGITLQGTIDGRELVLNFTEQGEVRTGNGRFVLSIGADETMRGSFASDATRSRGTIYARRRR